MLGCTHYPFAANTIRELVGRHTQLLDGGEGTARRTRQLLEEKGLLSSGPGEIVIENSLEREDILSLSSSLLNT